MGAHINAAGLFQSDKYPGCPAGKVPLSVKDPTAQDLLWTYAQRRRAVDGEFAEDLEAALRSTGYVAPAAVVADVERDVLAAFGRVVALGNPCGGNSDPYGNPACGQCEHGLRKGSGFPWVLEHGPACEWVALRRALRLPTSVAFEDQWHTHDGGPQAPPETP